MEHMSQVAESIYNNLLPVALASQKLKTSKPRGELYIKGRISNFIRSLCGKLTWLGSVDRRVWTRCTHQLYQGLPYVIYFLLISTMTLTDSHRYQIQVGKIGLFNFICVLSSCTKVSQALEEEQDTSNSNPNQAYLEWPPPSPSLENSSTCSNLSRDCGI